MKTTAVRRFGEYSLTRLLVSSRPSLPSRAHGRRAARDRPCRRAGRTLPPSASGARPAAKASRPREARSAFHPSGGVPGRPPIGRVGLDHRFFANAARQHRIEPIAFASDVHHDPASCSLAADPGRDPMPGSWSPRRETIARPPPPGSRYCSSLVRARHGAAQRAHLREDAAQAEGQRGIGLEHVVAGAQRESLVQGVPRLRRGRAVAERPEERALGPRPRQRTLRRGKRSRGVEVQAGGRLQVAALGERHVAGHQPLEHQPLLEGRGRGRVARRAVATGRRSVGGRFPFAGGLAGSEVRRRPAPQVGGAADRAGSCPPGPGSGPRPPTRGRAASRSARSPSRETSVSAVTDAVRRPGGASPTWSCMVTSLVISYSRAPDGTLTSTMSPSSWPRRHLPIGDDGEIRPDRGVRLLGGHDLVDGLLAVARVAHVDDRAEAHLAPRDPVEVDEGQRGHAAVELADARLQEALPLLGRLVLGVLAQVAVLARGQDLLGELDLQLVVERPDLLLQPLLYIEHSANRRPRKHPS